jgi:hypothetical protein
MTFGYEKNTFALLSTVSLYVRCDSTLKTLHLQAVHLCDFVIFKTNNYVYPFPEQNKPISLCNDHAVLVTSYDPENYARGSLLMVGCPIPDRSKVMTQAKRDALALQVGGS